MKLDKKQMRRAAMILILMFGLFLSWILANAQAISTGIYVLAIFATLVAAAACYDPAEKDRKN